MRPAGVRASGGGLILASPNHLTIAQLLRRRLLVMLGKGGVGRSALSAAIALIAARRGRRTLIIEADPQAPIAAVWGAPPSFAPVELAENLRAMMLGGQASLEQYLGLVVPRPVLSAVLRSRLYQYFVHAAPAVRELTMMGKVFHEIERRAAPLEPWDLVIFDAPASGQALSMIRTPFAAGAAFGESVAGREARNIAALLGDADKCAMVAATTAEPLAIAETLELGHALEALGLGLGAAFFNRASVADFGAGELQRMARLAARDPALGAVDELEEIARGAIRRRARERRALGLLRRRLGCGVIEVADRRGLAGARLFEALAAQLADAADPAARSSAWDASAPRR